MLLFLENGVKSNTGQILKNNSLISASSLTFEYGLACYSPETENNEIGEWRFPNGNRVEPNTIKNK